ncbi:S-adenosyl-L-methionine-dependent methyltransferase [Jaminaea rosea]|uniref:S-adenosyl-L-methionine-dependent methyltransferase n=1 Tax=Jaminaea rosea TaxID=1569628 RepID=A0A316UPJ5_9BASI|nr:S-adenosyl-L-methionine-dependent methyltransferase [Jaminaea rosea]PWN26894.1 S-adenosyl-L-methionine-dependent methyltransferase [Jaminaea rosea]
MNETATSFPGPGEERTERETLLDRLQGNEPFDQDTLDAVWAYHQRHSSKWGTVLDLGCGFGPLLPQLSQRFKRVVARDPDAESIQLAKALLWLGDEALAAHGLPAIHRGTHFDIAVGSDSGLDVAPSSVDCIIAASSAHLWDWYDPAGLYSRLANILRPGGTLIILGTKPIALPPTARSGRPSCLTTLTAHPVKHVGAEAEQSPSSMLGSESLYSTLLMPADNSQWDVASHSYWIFGPYRAAGFVDVESQDPPDWLAKHIAECLRASKEGQVDSSDKTWTPRGIAAWLRQTPLFASLREADPRERMLASLDQDRAAQLVRGACEEDGGVGWDDKVGRSSIEVIWALSRRAR